MTVKGEVMKEICEKIDELKKEKIELKHRCDMQTIAIDALHRDLESIRNAVREFSDDGK